MKTVDRIINYISSNKKSHFGLFLIVLTTLSLLMIFCYDPVYRGDDFYFHLRRLNALADALRDGTFPAYIDYKALQGYGYLSSVFYPDVILIPFAALSFVTGTLFAYNSMLLIMTILCGVFMYKAIYVIYKNSFAAFISGLLFCFCNYRLFDIYNRAALGESLAFTFFPIILLGMYYIIKGDYKRNWYVLAIGYTLLIYTHLLSSVIAFILIVLFLLIYYKPLKEEPKRLIYLCLAAIVTVLMTAYYTFPMIEQMVSNSFYYKTHSWVDPTLYSTSIYWLLLGMIEGLTQPEQFFFPKIGLFLTFGICLRLFVRGKSKELKSIDIFVIVAIGLLILSSSIIPWGKFPFKELRVIQFPWRLFAFVSFFFAIAGGYYLSQLVKSRRRMAIASFFVIAFAALIIAGDSQNYRRTVRADQVLTTPNITNHYLGGGKEYLPSRIESTDYICKRGDEVITNYNTTRISNFIRSKNITSFDISIANADHIEVPLIYYKGYKAVLNGNKLPVVQSSRGLIEITANQSGRVEVYYTGTTLLRVSFWISIISILALCTFVFVSRKKKEVINLSFH